MATDVILAWLHHLCFIGMAAMLAMQWAWLAPGQDRIALERLVRCDNLYGGLATLILVVGTARVILGPKGADFYLHNPVFWAKIGVFLAVGAVSAYPTINFQRWKKQAAHQPGFQPEAAGVAAVRKALRIEAAGWIALPVLAAAMARGVGLAS